MLASGHVGMPPCEAHLHAVEHPCRRVGGSWWRRALQAMHPHHVAQEDEEAEPWQPCHYTVPAGRVTQHACGVLDTHPHWERKDAVKARCLTMLHGTSSSDWAGGKVVVGVGHRP